MDDIELNRIIIKRPLLASGAIVLEASVASEAIEKISALAATRSLWISVITDLNMPGSSGLDLCREIRKDNRKVPIIMLSSSGLTEEMKALDVTRCLVSPLR